MEYLLCLEPDAEYFTTNFRKKVAVKPISVRTNNGKWSIFAYVIYANSVYEAEFLVYRDGNVEMVNDIIQTAIII